MSQADVLKAIAVTSELCGTNLSEAAARVLLDDLAKFDEQAVVLALSKCRRELKGRLTLAEIVSRIDDGRPGAEEAWAMLPKDEDTSVVWTQEMIDAWSIARALIDEGEMVPARMAFKEAYLRLIAESRDEGRPVRWIPSLGHDKAGREEAVNRAVEQGRLTHEHAASLLPPPEGEAPFAEFLLTGNVIPMLEAQDPRSRGLAERHLERMKQMLGGTAEQKVRVAK